MSLNSSQISFLNRGAGSGRWEYNEETGLVDINGDFSYTNSGITDLRGVKFGSVSGDFSIKGNIIDSLEGSPIMVEGIFDCSNNDLTSLEGAPKYVLGFNCSYNEKLKSLVGGPQCNMGEYIAKACSIESLEGSPKVAFRFDVRRNLISSLKGGPEKVCDLNLSFCELTSIDELPEFITRLVVDLNESNIPRSARFRPRSMSGVGDLDLSHNITLKSMPLLDNFRGFLNVSDCHGDITRSLPLKVYKLTAGSILEVDLKKMRTKDVSVFSCELNGMKNFESLPSKFTSFRSDFNDIVSLYGLEGKEIKKESSNYSSRSLNNEGLSDEIINDYLKWVAVNGADPIRFIVDMFSAGKYLIDKKDLVVLFKNDLSSDSKFPDAWKARLALKMNKILMAI